MSNEDPVVVTERRRLVWVSLLASVAVGAFAGSGVFTFFTAHGAAYLSDDPGACVHCHVRDSPVSPVRAPRAIGGAAL